MTAEPTFDIMLYWQVLRRRSWLVLIPVVLMTGILGLGSLLIPNIYRTNAQAIVRQEQDAVKGLAADAQLTQQLGGVIQGLQLPLKQKEIFERLKPVVPKGLKLEACLADFRDHLQIQRREEGKDLIVDVVYEGTPEKYATEVVNAFLDEFEKQGTRLVASSLQVSLEFVDDQLKSYRDRLKKLDTEERQVKGQLKTALGDLAPMSAIEGLGKFVAERLANGESDIQKLDVQVNSLTAQSSYLNAELAQTRPTLSLRGAERGDPTEAELERLLAETQAKLTASQMKYTTKHPEVMTLKRQTSELRNRLADARARHTSNSSEQTNPSYDNLRKEALKAEAELRLAQSQRATLQARNDKLRKAAAQMPTIEEQLVRIRDERDAVKTTYQSLLQRKQGLELNQSFEEGQRTGRFDSRRAGGVPLRPVRPNRKKFVIMGFLAGLFIGISFMLLAEYLDHSLRAESDLRRYVEAPLLAVLPRTPD